MARPIKATPTLAGKDAERFLRLVNEPRPETKEKMAEMKRDYEWFKEILEH